MLRSPAFFLCALTLLSAGVHLSGKVLSSVEQPATAAAAVAEALPAANPFELNAQAEDRKAWLHAQALRKKQFNAYADRVVRQVAAREIGLREACELLRCYSAARYPAFLDYTVALESGPTLRVMVARAVYRLVSNSGPEWGGIAVPVAVLATLGEELGGVLQEDGDDVLDPDAPAGA